MSEIEMEKMKDYDSDPDVNSIYTTLSDAKTEIWNRWNDEDLRKKVKDYLGEIPEVFRNEPRAAISRSIITPNQELFYFLDLAEHSNLKPLGLEGSEDKFCTKNYDKVSLGKLSFLSCNDLNKSGYEKRNVGVIDMMECDGMRLCDIKTFWGEGLVKFHHRILESYGVDIEKFDDFMWFNHSIGEGNVLEYYKKFFAIFVCHGILFDNFIVKRNEKSFTDDIIMTSFREVENLFGKKPLIVPLLPRDDDDHFYFRSYINKIG